MLFGGRLNNKRPKQPTPPQVVPTTTTKTTTTTLATTTSSSSTSLKLPNFDSLSNYVFCLRGTEFQNALKLFIPIDQTISTTDTYQQQIQQRCMYISSAMRSGPRTKCEPEIWNVHYPTSFEPAIQLRTQKNRLIVHLWSYACLCLLSGFESFDNGSTVYGAIESFKNAAAAFEWLGYISPKECGSKFPFLFKYHVHKGMELMCVAIINLYEINKTQKNRISESEVVIECCYNALKYTRLAFRAFLNNNGISNMPQKFLDGISDISVYVERWYYVYNSVGWFTASPDYATDAINSIGFLIHHTPITLENMSILVEMNRIYAELAGFKYKDSWYAALSGFFISQRLFVTAQNYMKYNVEEMAAELVLDAHYKSDLPVQTKNYDRFALYKTLIK